MKRPILSPARGRLAALVAGLLVLVAVPVLVFRPHENRFEREARRITEAIVKGDLAPVAADFTPNTRANFTPESVALAAKRLGSLGALKSIRDETPHDAAPGTHELVAIFERGRVPEHLAYAEGGLIVTFHYDAPLKP